MHWWKLEISRSRLDLNDVFHALNGGKVMNNMNISNLEYALDKIRQVKDGTLKKPMDKTKYI